MRKILTAISFAALALAGIGMGMGTAQTNVQVADVEYDFPTNAQEDDVRLRGPSTSIKKVADTRDDQRSSPHGGNDDPHMRLFSGSKA